MRNIKHKKKNNTMVKYNLVFTILAQIIAFITGFYVNKVILIEYGSTINGLVASINNWLAFFSILDLGVGASMTASLYKPISTKNYSEISKIVASGQKVINSLSCCLLGYVLILTFLYPLLIKEFSYQFVAVLVLVIGASCFVQFYFGRINGILIMASNDIYFYQISLISLYLIKIFLCIVMVSFETSIHVFLLGMSLAYLIQPILLIFFVNRKYKIDRKIKYDKEPIEQKWNGILQRVSTVVLEKTDIIVLTIWSDLSTLSLYAVYNLILANVYKVIESLSYSFQSLLGKKYVEEDKGVFLIYFDTIEFLFHKGSILIFLLCALLIEPFVMIYTSNVLDVDYSNVIFGYLLSIAFYFQSYRIPYIMLIHVMCKFKEVEKSAILEVCINILISIIAVYKWGVIGVTLGTIASVMYRTIFLGIYFYKKQLGLPAYKFFKKFIFDFIFMIVGIFILRYKFDIHSSSYIEWLEKAIILIIPVSVGILIECNVLFVDDLKKIKRAMIRT